MEYHREDSTQDNEVRQPVKGWPGKKRKVSWVDRIKKIGMEFCICINLKLFGTQHYLNTFYQIILQRKGCCLVRFSSLPWFMVQLRQRFITIEIISNICSICHIYVFFVIG